MTQTASLPLPSPIAETSRVLLDGYRFRVEETREDRQFLVCSDNSGTHREILLRELGPLRDTGSIVEEENFFNADGSVAPIERADANLSGMTDDQLYDCHWMDQNVLVLDKAYKAGEVKLHEKSLDAYFTPQIQMEIHVETLKRLDRDTKFRKGQKTGFRGRPSASDFKRAYRLFRRPGYRIEDHRKHYYRCTQGGKRLEPFVQVVSENAIMEFHANEQRMNRSAIRRLIGARLNEGKPEGQWTKQPPTDGAIKRIIAGLKESRLIGSQHGVDTMEDKSGSWTKGPIFTRPGEMVQLDCYKTDIVVFLQRAGIWANLSPAWRKLLGEFRRRVWLCVCIDVATRCILGVSFGLAESAELAVRALRMALSDKSLYAKVASCGAEPPRAIGIAGIRTDSGSAFRSARFQTVAYNVTRNVQIGVVGVSRHRGNIERFFRTSHEGFISFWTGRTFSNVVERGDYDAVARVSAFLVDFGNGFFRWCTDVYHGLGHAGIDHQPPMDCLNEAISNTGFVPVMNSDRFRISFGIDFERKPTPLGVRFAGIQYSANWMAERFKNRRGGTIRLKVDPEDLGRISVLVDGQWATLPGPPEMQGIPLSFWKMKCEALARKHGAQARIRFETVAKALLAFADQSAEARCKAQLEDWSYNSEKLKQADERIKLNFVYRPIPRAHGGPLIITQSDGYSTGARLSLPARVKEPTAQDPVDDDEVFGFDLQDPESPPTEDDRLAADNDNIGEDPIPDDEEGAEAEDSAKPKRSKPKAKASGQKKPPVNLDWAPSPRINNIKKTG